MNGKLTFESQLQGQNSPQRSPQGKRGAYETEEEARLKDMNNITMEDEQTVRSNGMSINF